MSSPTIGAVKMVTRLVMFRSCAATTATELMRKIFRHIQKAWSCNNPRGPLALTVFPSSPLPCSLGLCGSSRDTGIDTILGDWALHCHVFSALWSSVFLCVNLFLSQREASVRRRALRSPTVPIHALEAAFPLSGQLDRCCQNEQAPVSYHQTG